MSDKELMQLAKDAAMLEIVKKLVRELDTYDIKRVMLALFREDEPFPDAPEAPEA